MLKFLDGRDIQTKTRRSIDKMRQSSHSFLPNNKQFSSPLHQETILTNDKPTNYIYKKLPPIEIYNPINQIATSVDRPEYIVKQKDVYIPKYQAQLKKGFNKKSGIFQSYQHLYNKNIQLIQGIHPEKRQEKLQEKLIEFRREKGKETQKETNQENNGLKLPIINVFPPLESVSITESQTTRRKQRKSGQTILSIQDSQLSKQSLTSSISQNKSRLDNDNQNGQIVKKNKFEDRYIQQKEEESEKQQMMHQLSVFEKQIEALRYSKKQENRYSL